MSITPRALRLAYERQAPDYDARFAAQQSEKIAALAAAAPPRAGLWVDVGAGTGLVSRLTGRRVLSVDFAAAMLRQAPAPRALADLRALPLRDGVAAEVWSVTALLGSVRAADALREWARVLAPGGLMRVSVLAPRAAEVEAALSNAGLRALTRLAPGPDVAWALVHGSGPTEQGP